MIGIKTSFHLANKHFQWCVGRDLCIDRVIEILQYIPRCSMNYYRYTYYFKSYIVKICCVQFHTDAMLEVSDIEKLPQCLVVHASTKLEKICKGIWIISKVVNFLRRDYSNLFVSKNTSNSPICISSVPTDIESKKKIW